MQLDRTTEKLIRLLALEKKRVKELREKVQEGKQKAADPRLRALVHELKKRLPEVHALEASVAEAQKRLHDFEALKEALFKSQETHAKLRGEIRELQEKLTAARDYGAEMQRKLIERDRTYNASDERYIDKLLQARTTQKHALALRYLLDQFKTPPDQVDALERLLAARVKQATELQVQVEVAQRARADAEAEAQKLSLRTEWAEEKLAALQQQITGLEERAAHYNELEEQYKQMSEVVNRLRNLGNL